MKAVEIYARVRHAVLIVGLMPPMENPNRLTLSKPMALMNVIASLVICSIDAAGEPLDAQTPRLSKVTT